MGERLPGVEEYSWRTRGGGRMSIRFEDWTQPGLDRDECREQARRQGWPGHDGTWWRYLLDDVRRLSRGRRWAQWEVTEVIVCLIVSAVLLLLFGGAVLLGIGP